MQSLKSKIKTNLGFTLVELLVSMSIFLVISTVVLVKHSEFNGTILVTNLAYEIALQFRQAQIFGLSVKETSEGSEIFTAGYGLHFNVATPNSFIFFADLPTNPKIGEYDGGLVSDCAADTTRECQQKIVLPTGYVIKDFCASAGAVSDCGTAGILYLNVTFKRPAPNALIKTSNSTQSAYSLAKITIESPKGGIKQIHVHSTGQISIK